MAGTDENSAPESEVLEQGWQGSGRLETLGRSRGVRLAASGLLATAVLGWLFLGPGVPGLTSARVQTAETAGTDKAPADPASQVVPPDQRDHECKSEGGGGSGRDAVGGRADAGSRALAAKLYRFARDPAGGHESAVGPGRRPSPRGMRTVCWYHALASPATTRGRASPARPTSCSRTSPPARVATTSTTPFTWTADPTPGPSQLGAAGRRDQRPSLQLGPLLRLVGRRCLPRRARPHCPRERYGSLITETPARGNHTDDVELVFVGQVIEWRGPSPYYFVPVPDEESADIREVASIATYGWGVIPVQARIGETAFETSLFPKDGGYLLPLKDAVRKPLRISAGDDVTVDMTIRQ